LDGYRGSYCRCLRYLRAGEQGSRLKAICWLNLRPRIEKVDFDSAVIGDKNVFRVNQAKRAEHHPLAAKNIVRLFF
jgi:hypothetical protein